MNNHVRRNLDGIFRRTTARVVEEYVQHPFRWAMFLITTLFALPLAVLGWGYSPSTSPSIVIAANGVVVEEGQLPLFPASVVPSFTVENNQEIVRKLNDRQIIDGLEVDKDNVVARVYDSENRLVDLNPEIQSDADAPSRLVINVPPERDFHPGRYRLETIINDGVKDITLKQDFLWGVLAINLDRSSYSLGQSVMAMMAVLDDRGVTLCGADLDLAITDPNDQVRHLTSATGEIVTSPICEDKHVTNTPDYSTHFVVNQEGTYQLSLIAETKNGRRLIRSTFEVTPDQDFVVSRPSTSMRIYPPSEYTVKIDLIANQDFNGQISETLPASFAVSNARAMIRRQGTESATTNLQPTITTNNSEQILSWDEIKLAKNDSVFFEYTYRAPPISPQFYLMGPLELRGIGGSLVFSEPRAWQVASDAVVTWDGGGTDGTCGGGAGDGNKWSCTLNWSGDALPTSTDVATFDSTSTKNANITAAIGTIDGLDIASGYTGTITNQVSSGTVVTLTTSFSQVTGTFDGGSTAAIVDNGTFSLTGGTFTSTSGNFTVKSTFTISGSPVFNHNSGTFTFSTNAATLTPSTVSFYAVSFTSAVTKTIASSQTMTVVNTLTLTDGSINQTTIPATGSIAAQGDITEGTLFDGGTGLIVISGGANQNLTGSGSATLGALPDIEINKSGNTLTLVSTIRLNGNNWTYTAGTIDAGSSTLVLTGTLTVTGSHTLNNLTFAANIITIASGTTITVPGTLYYTTSGVNTINTGGISAKGPITIDGTSTTGGGNAKVTINGDGDQTLTGSGTASQGKLPSVIIDKTSGTLTFASIITVARAWTYTAGTLAVGTSTIVFSNSASIGPTISGSMAFNNLSFEKLISNGATYIIASGTTLTVNGNLTLNHTNATNEETIDGPGTITVAGNISVTGSSSSTGFNGNVAITMNGGSNTTFTTNTSTFPTGDVTVSKTAGYKVSLLSNINFDASSQDLTITSGTLDLDSYTLSVNGASGILIVNSGGNLQLAGTETITLASTIQLDSGSTVTYDGAVSNATLKDYTYRNLTIAGGASIVFTLPSNQASVQTLTITTGIMSLGGFNLTATTLVNNDVLRRQGNETVSITTMDTDSGTVQYVGRNVVETLTIKDFGSLDYYHLTINDANANEATYQLGAALDINGTLTITDGVLNTNAGSSYALTAGGLDTGSAGTLTTNGSTVSLTGTGTVFSMNASGTFTAATSTLKITNTSGTAVTFAGGGKTYNNIWFSRSASTASNTITGSNTFADFKDTGSAAHSLLFTNGTTTTVTTFTVSGSSGNVITINSDTTATHTLTKAGGGVIIRDYLNIQHSVATPATTWYAGWHSVDNQSIVTAGSGWIFTNPNDLTINSSATANAGSSPNWVAGDGGGNVNITDIQTAIDAGTSVSFTAAGDVIVSNAFTKTAGVDVTMTMYADRNIRVSAAISSSNNKMTMTLNANRAADTSGYVNIAAALTSNAGDITIGGGSGTISAGSGFAVGNSGQVTGVLVNGVTVAAGGGNVIVNGQGFSTTTNSNLGIRVTGAAGALTSTGSGTVSLTGNGAGTTNSATNYGLEIDAGGIISTVDGNLTVNNSTGGGAGSGASNLGVYITGTSSTIKTTGSGNLAVTGTGGNSSGSGGNNYGVYCVTASCLQTTSTGTITVTGTGGNGSSGSGDSNYGVYVSTPGSITGAGGAITITGTGGASSGDSNVGVAVVGAAATVTNTGSGTISITGTGAGITNSGTDYGLLVNTGGIVSTVNGNLTVNNSTGGGAGTGIQNYGVYITATSSTIKTTGSGNLAVTGTGGNPSGSGGNNYGVYCVTANCLQTTSTGTISVTGTGGNGSSGSGGANYGVYVNTPGSITGAGGAITITGTGGASSGNSNLGIFITGAAATVTNTGSGTITLTGTGAGITNSKTGYGIMVNTGAILSTVNGNLTVNNSTGGGAGTGIQNYGVYITATSSTIKTTGSGNLAVTGTGGNSSGSGGSNHGVFCETANCFQTTSTGTITVTGTGGNGSSGSGASNYGVHVATPGSITGAGGAIAVTGTGGASSGSTNIGIRITGASATITNTGSGTINFTGTGAGITNSATDYGLQVDAGAITSTADGNLTVTGTGGGAGTGTNNYGVYVTGTSSTIKTTGGGNLSMTGVRGSGDTATNYGVRIAVANGLQTTGTGNITGVIDTILMAQANDINSIGNLTIRPYTASTTIGVGSGSGTLALTDTFLTYITWGASSTLTIGGTAAGNIAINTSSTILNQSVTFLTGGDITLATTALAHAGASAATLTMQAYGSITTTSAITATTSALTILLYSDFDANASGSISIGAGVSSNAGTITVRGGGGTITTTSAFDNLTIDIGSNTITLGANLNDSGDLTITAGTLDVSATAYAVNIGGSYSNSGNFNSRTGTVTFNATSGSKTLAGQMTGTSDDFYTLVFDGVGGGWSFSAAAEVTNDFTITNGTVTAPSTTLTVTGNYANTGTFTHNSGTVTLNATDSGNTLTGTMTTTSGFNNLTFNGSGGAWSFAANSADVATAFTITNGTVTAPSTTLTVSGDFANSGTFTHNSGTVTLAGSATQTLSGTLTSGSSFYNLTLSNSSGTDASDCERTSFVPGVDFAAAATVTNNYTITTASVRVEYNTGSTYTINNMNWNGQAAGTRLYFRNSAATGTWLLNVTAVGNAQTKVTYINVSRSDASGGALIIASDGTNTDCGANTNWQFDETLSLSLDSTSKDFGTLTPDSNPSDQTSTLTAGSNAVNGFVIYGWSTQAMTNTRFGGVTLADWTGTNATPTTFSAGSYGFGYSTDDSSLTGGTADRFTSGGAKFAGFSHSGPGDPVADRTAPVTGATNTITYRLYPSSTQADGDYTTVIVYVITALFP